MAIAPEHAEAHCNLGIARRELGRLDAAVECFERALALKSDYAEAHYNLGVALHMQKRWGEAIASYRKAVALGPNYAPAHYRLGLVFEAQGQMDDAAASYERAVALDPDFVDAHFRLGNAVHKLNRCGEAVVSYRRALELRPDYAEVHVNLAVALQADGRCEEAMASYGKALELKPDFALAHHNLGIALREQGRLDEAAASFRQALAADPASADAYFNLGVVLGAQGRLDDAIASYRNALAQRPDYAKAHSNIGAVHQAQGHIDDAIASFERALALQPDLPAVHANLALALFLKGEFARGAEEYEWRWQAPGFTPLRKYEAPPWDGRPLPDGTVLLWVEQGYGDAIQFARYAPLVRERCGRVVLDCPKDLAALMATVPGVDEVAVWGGPAPTVAAQVPLMSLIRLFETRLETIPASVPYLAADPARVANFRGRIEAAAGLKVGLVWAGRPNHVNDRNRSLALSELRPLLEVEGASFFSLQKGPGEGKFAESGLSERLVDLAPLIGDFADTAAAISCLDLVISVDTAVAHLGGALAKPVWTLLPFAPDWRWLMEREDSPWYPTMRLFRQPALGDWASVVRSVVEALRAAREESGDFAGAGRQETPARHTQGGDGLLAEAWRHHQSGRLDEAEALYRQIIAINPKHFEALYGFGAIAAQRADHAAVEAWISRALAVMPDYAEAHYNLGIAQRQQGGLEPAEASFRRALALKADYVEAHYNLGIVLQAQRRWDEAVAAYRNALVLNPNYMEAHYNNALALKALDRLEEAAASFRRALVLEPNHAPTHFNLGLVLEDQGQLEDAAASYNRAVALDLGHVEAHLRLGNALHKLRRPEEAAVSYGRVLELRPDYAEVHVNLGVALQAQHRLEEAMASCRRAIDLKSDYAEAHFGLASILLLTGNFAEGAAEYEWRSRVEGAPRLPAVDAPMWDGRTIPDETLLVRAEQGLGDAIQYVRYAPLARKRCGRVVLECPSALLPLMATAQGVDAVVPWGRSVAGIAAQVPLMSLMRIFETRLETIPASVPYLAADPARVAKFRERICAAAGLKVGLAWAGNPVHRSDWNRSLRLAALAPLLGVDGVSFFSLQKGERAGEIAELGLSRQVVDLGPALDDFADTTAAVSCLDLVISVDTAVAHLAGALAKPVWTLLPFVPDWRWLLARDDSPWYPTMQLYRQPTFGDWASVVAAVAEALHRTARGEADVLIETRREEVPCQTVDVEKLLTGAQRYQQAGRLAAAEDSYHRILAIHPDHFGALYGIGAVAAQRGDHQAAGAWLGRALAVAPHHVEAHYNLGTALSHQGRYEDAIASFQQALALKPDLAMAHHYVGNAHRELGRLDEAVASYRRALAISPESAVALYNLGNVLQAQGQFSEAIAWYERALLTEPRQADIHLNLGNALQATGRLDEAVARFETVLNLVPTHAGAYFNIGNARSAQRRWEEAVASYERALVLKSDYFDAHNNLGLALQSLGRLDEARAHFEQALTLQPGNAWTRFNLGLILLLTGDFERGTAEYECRRQVEGAPQPAAPAWDGRPLPGKAILLQAEQGLGDTIQFARYASLVRARCGRVVVQCSPPLTELLATVPGVDEVTSSAWPPTDIAAAAPLPSLMHLLGTRLETIPAEVPYLAVDPARVASLRERMGEAAGLKVGLVWAGNPAFTKDRDRSLASLSMLVPLLGVEGVAFFSLQKGEREGEIAALGLSDRIVDLAPALNDFADTAAAISQLDLVISTCTSVPHLAGALGKPVWTMIPFAPDWRWLLDRSDSPWYPTMRLFRQPAFGDWTSVVAAVAEALRGIAHGDRRLPAKPSYQATRAADEGEIFAEAQRHHQAGRLVEAETLYHSILTVCANHVGALRQLGMAALQRGDHQGGEKWMRRVLAVAAEDAEAYAHLGNALYGQNRLDEAASCFRQALAIDPGYAMAHFNLANPLREQGRLDEAISSYRRAVELAPNHPEAYLNLGVTLRALGDTKAAIASYERALALRPDYSEAHFNLGLALMLTGDIARGAQEYEWRWRVGNTARLPHIDVPLWDGRQQVDGALLVRAEQGLGDTIQFVRFAGTIRPRCQRLVLQCLEPLAPLMATAPGVDEVIVWGQAVPAVAAQVPLMSLMRLLGTELGTIPAEVPYLVADPVRVKAFQERIGGYTGLKVGVVWGGNPGQMGDRYRSLALSALRPVLEVEGASFFSLQKGPREGELAASTLHETLVDLAPLLGDLADTAAAISCLDLVISVDTAVAHLAGALAKPVWTLLPFAPDWRWLLERADSPWYPTMRLFRQPALGDWASVVQSVVDTLEAARGETKLPAEARRQETSARHAQGGEELLAEARQYHQSGRLDEAEVLYHRVIAINPEHFEALYGLGAIAAQRGDHRVTEAWISRAVVIAPNHAEAYANLGNAQREQGRLEAAVASLRRALALRPDHATAHLNIGAAYQALGRVNDAIASFERALTLQPDYSEAHFNLGLALMLTGDIARGAQEYEWRWRVGNTARLPHIDVPLWDGRQQVDGALLVRAEQGLGDTIQFVRFAGTIRPRCQRLVLQCLEPLAPLMATAPGVDEVIVWGQAVPAVAAQVPLMSLMRLLGTELETIPAQVPYLVADPARVKAFQERIGEYPGLKVGVVWAGNPAFKNDRDRSLASLSMLKPLLGLEGVAFFSLQKGGREGEIAALGLSDRIVDLAPALHEFADTAAAISQLDLVISTCTSVPHLAGALAKPVWTLLPFAPDWRWLLERADSPWYPTMRLFRQPAVGDWASVVRSVVEALEAVRGETKLSAVVRRQETLARRAQGGEELLAEARRHHQIGRLDESEVLYRRVVGINPEHFEALYGLGAIAAHHGDHRATEAWLKRALAVTPDHAEAHYNLGIAQREQGCLEAAAASFRQAVSLKPDYAEAHHDLGFALQGQGRLEEAVESYGRALALRPDFALAHHNLGIALREQGRLDEAAASFRQALAVNAEFADAHFNLGVVLGAQGGYEEAIASYRRVLALRPDFAKAHGNIGAAQHAQGHLDQAIASFERALALQPDDPAVHANLAMTLFLKGEFARAAEEYEWRWQAPGFTPLRKHEAPPWDGRPLPDGAVLLRVEQGYGDAIQFGRYAPLVRERCGRVVLECPKELAVLMATVPGVDEVVSVWGGPAPAVAAQVPLMSLIRLFETRLETIPASAPYLAADPARVANFRRRIEAAAGLKVGLVWAGRPNHVNDRNRSLALSELRPLLEVEGASFFSLQKGTQAKEIAASGLAGRLIDLGPALGDFADTAAAVSCLDLVISVDTAVAHLGGALAKPVWTLLPFAPDWRWLMEREDSPWYPTMRLFRQPSRGDWASVIDAVAGALRRAAQNRGDSLAAALPQLGQPVATGVDLFAAAQLQHQAGQLAEAEGLYRQLLATDPDHVRGLHHLGIAAAQRGDHQAAEKLINHALSLAPDYAEGHYDLGNALMAQGRPAEAVASFRRALALKPDYAEAHFNLGNALRTQGRIDEAEASYRRAAELGPDHPEAHLNLGAVLRHQGRVEDAMASYRRALALKPDYAQAHFNLGNALDAKGQLEEAVASFERAIALKPDLVPAHANLGMVLLLKGDFARGAAEYEWRWRADDFPRLPPLEAPAWDGRPVPGQTLLLRAEQGSGDAIQFVRYAPLVRARCGRVVLQCDASLMRLLATAPEVDEVIAWGQAPPAIAAQAPLLSLMHLLGTRLDTIPATVPYLAAGPARIVAFQQRIGATAGLKVGLVWAGNPAQKNDRNRSLKLAALAPLLEVEGVSFFSLQKGERAGEIATLRRPAQVIDLGPTLSDFADTAAAVSCLDLVISVDTAVAHLAGALARPVWTLLPFAPNWRWLMEREDSPWYPTMRLFRQPSRGDWASVISAVAEALRRAARDRGDSLAAAQRELGQPVAASVDVFAEAQRQHQMGRLVKAEALYRRLLASDPDHVGALHHLGIAAAQRGDHAASEKLISHALSLAPDYAEGHYDLGKALTAQGRLAEAVASFERALALRPDHVEAHNGLGNVFQALGRIEEAVASFGRAVALKPEYAEAHFNLGNALRTQGRIDEAVARYRRAAELAPDHPEAHVNLGVALRQQGRVEDAVASYRRALALRPNYVDAYSNLGVALQAESRLEEAEGSYRRALALAPNHPEAHLNLGAVLRAQGRIDDAVANYRRALALRPNNADAHSNLGNALQAQGRLDEAVASCRRALALRPDHTDAYRNLGNVLQAQGRLDEAVASYKQALALKPDYADVHSNLGAALQAQGQLEEAEARFERAIALKPDLVPAHCNLGIVLLLKGDLSRGSVEFEWRWRAEDFPRLPPLDPPAWGGQPIPGETLLLRAEQGFGDAIQFVRYATLVRARCGRVVLQCDAPLIRLLATAPGVDDVIAWDQPLPAIAAHAPLLSLMHLLGTRLETIPATVPYLAADPARIAAFQERMAATAGLKVGLAWAGRPIHKNDHNRSLAFVTLAPLLAAKGVSFFSLQKGAQAEEITASGLAGRLTDLAPALGDFADTAAAVSCLDLVISVDTAIAHLAGALAKPVWILLPFAPDWRWLLGRADSPWYPTMRLYRQHRAGDWESVLGRVAADLRQHGANKQTAT